MFATIGITKFSQISYLRVQLTYKTLPLACKLNPLGMFLQAIWIRNTALDSFDVVVLIFKLRSNTRHDSWFQYPRICHFLIWSYVRVHCIYTFPNRSCSCLFLHFWCQLLDHYEFSILHPCSFCFFSSWQSIDRKYSVTSDITYRVLYCRRYHSRTFRLIESWT